MSKAQRKADLRVCEHIRSRYSLVDVKPEAGLFNLRCYCNAVEYARTHESMGVLEVIYIENNKAILHYINRQKDTGALLEITLGFMAEHLEYYIIRTIHPDDYKHIALEFERSLDSWLMQFTSWFDRKLFGVDRVV